MQTPAQSPAASARRLSRALAGLVRGPVARPLGAGDMSVREQGSGIRDQSAPVARLQGAMSVVLAVSFPWLQPPSNPYAKGSVQAAAWKRGFAFQARAALPADVSRATIDEMPAPGRGRSRRGPRHEWSEAEKTVAWCAQAALTRAEISALMPRHSPQAVSNQICRMKARMTGIRDQGSVSDGRKQASGIRGSAA